MIVIHLLLLSTATILGALPELGKVTTGFVISGCFYVGPHGATRLPLHGFS
jgi:hypothetical protein